VGIQKHPPWNNRPDCRSPTEAALLPPTNTDPVGDFSDYRQEMIASLANARVEAANNIRKAQSKYKKQHDKKTHQIKSKIGDWVLVYFPKDMIQAGIANCQGHSMDPTVYYK